MQYRIICINSNVGLTRSDTYYNNKMHFKKININTSPHESMWAISIHHRIISSSTAPGLYSTIKRSTFSSKALPSKIFWLWTCMYLAFLRRQSLNISYKIGQKAFQVNFTYILCWHNAFCFPVPIMLKITLA